MQTWTWSRRLTLIFMAKKKSCREAASEIRATLDGAPARRASATLGPRHLSSRWARLQTDPQHTPPPLPLLRSRPGGVRGASVVRSLKPDKFSRSSRRAAPGFRLNAVARSSRAVFSRVLLPPAFVLDFNPF